MPKCRTDRRLTADEEQALAARVQSGDLDARNELVECNMALVFAVAGTLNERRLPYEDQISCGVIGLIRAASCFKPGFGRFSTYAWPSILRSINKHRREDPGVIFAGECVASWVRRYELQDQEYRLRGEAIPDDERFAADSGLTVVRVECARAAIHSRIWIHTQFRENREDRETGDKESRGCYVEDYRSVPREFEEDELADLRVVLSRMLPRWRQVLLLRAEGYEFIEIGSMLGISKQRVHQIHAKATKRLEFKLLRRRRARRRLTARRLSAHDTDRRHTAAQTAAA